jgi:hypothetical protein
MKKQIVIVGLVILLIFVGLSGCTETNSLSAEEKKFVGTWIMQGPETIITFYSDGQMGGDLGQKYEIKDGKLAILTEISGGYKQELYNYSFSDNETKLILIDINTNIEHILIKQ